MRLAIYGATSAIAQALAREYAKGDCELVLVGRNAERLDAVAADLRVRGAGSVVIVVADLAQVASLETVVAQAGAADVIVVAHGTLPSQAAATADAAFTVRALNENFVAQAALLTHVANALDAQGHGTLAVIGSVAGDRGRRTNYVYGSAKAGLNAFTEGLRHRLALRGVDVVLVKPGLVDTPMTADFRKGPLWSAPERVARDIRRGIERGAAVVYTPWYWRWIMCVIRALPDAIFKRLSL
jgi:short-subunit dehydrogenase